MLAETPEKQNDQEQSQIALLAAMILVHRRKSNCYPIPDSLIELVDQLIELAKNDIQPPMAHRPTRNKETAQQ